MRAAFLLLAITALHIPDARAQVRIDGTFPFQGDPAKQWSIYVPSGYSAGEPHRMMVAFHPFNTATWNSISWCDTLIVFAETNDLLLVCPDGGADGSMDDPLDTAFTTALLDSVRLWYSVDVEKTYAMGFSVGGRVTYTYGLSNPSVFGGYLPIGAAITNLNEVGPVIGSSLNEPFYLVHGSMDSPSTRYTPVLNALNANGAIVNSLLMSGVGHTINFPNRNAILGTAFQWIDSVNCSNILTSLSETPAAGDLWIHPTVIAPGGSITIRTGSVSGGEVLVRILNVSGAAVLQRRYPASMMKDGIAIALPSLEPGAYVVSMDGALHDARTIIVR